MDELDPSFLYLYRSPGISRYRRDPQRRRYIVETYCRPGVWLRDRLAVEEIEEDGHYVSPEEAADACRLQRDWWGKESRSSVPKRAA